MADQLSQTPRKNPWTRERLLQYLQQSESPVLEFKSSRPLCSDRERSRFVDDLAAHTGAFLNADGGLLLIGLEEGRRVDAPDVATELSPGVPRQQLTASRLQSMLCDRIHPSVADLVRVHSVSLGTTPEGELLAFAVEIRPGITAYQAPDLKYYVRRGYSSEPMEDKDIRLRMLSAQTARVSLAARLEFGQFRPGVITCGQMVRARVLLRVTNGGVRTIRRMSLAVNLTVVTPRTSERNAAKLPEWTADNPRIDWSSEDTPDRPLFPDDFLDIVAAEVDISGSWESFPVELRGRFARFLDDAPSSVLEVDLSEAYREAIDLIVRHDPIRTAAGTASRAQSASQDTKT